MDRKQVISWLEGLAQPDWYEFHSDTEVNVIAESALALLKEQEADMIALKNAYKELAEKGSVIVRCKDCKHWYFADNRIPSEQENVCGRNGIVVTPDWFCADGERKEGR